MQLIMDIMGTFGKSRKVLIAAPGLALTGPPVGRAATPDGRFERIKGIERIVQSAGTVRFAGAAVFWGTASGCFRCETDLYRETTKERSD
jgi:hypothetical protein